MDTLSRNLFLFDRLFLLVYLGRVKFVVLFLALAYW